MTRQHTLPDIDHLEYRQWRVLFLKGALRGGGADFFLGLFLRVNTITATIKIAIQVILLISFFSFLFPSL
jgi:hypothetical protein